MNTQEFRENVRERIVQAKDEKQHHERELERLDKIVTSLQNYLANDAEDTKDTAAPVVNTSIPPLAVQTPSQILLSLVRENDNPPQEAAYKRLIEAGHDFMDANRSRVVANALAMARKRVREERVGTATGAGA